MNQRSLVVLAAVSLLLSACGGSSTSTDTPKRGALAANSVVRVQTPSAGASLSSLDPASLTALLQATIPNLAPALGTPACTVSLYSMKYYTVGGLGEQTDASGAIMVPSGGAACSGPRPVLLYAHGTYEYKRFSMATLPGNEEALMVAATFAAQGYIVVAPNYAGYDTSSLNYHPYLNADQQSSDMIDGLRAARLAFAGIGAQDNGKLFVTGYSQGGHVAMATQRAMQLSYPGEFHVTAAAAQSGPYALGLTTDVILGGSPPLGGTIFTPLLATAAQRIYGNLYTTPGEMYEDGYAPGIESLLPGAMTATELFSKGKLPAMALFASDSLPGPSSPDFAPFFGPGNLVKTRFRNAALADIQNNPCNADPANPLNCAPANGLRKAAYKNDLRTYVPAVPLMLCGGHADPTVFFLNTLAADGYFRAKGMPGASLTTLDVDSAPPNANDPWAAVRLGFADAKLATINAAIAAQQDPATAVALAYHNDLVSTFCGVAVRSFFAQAAAH